MCDFSLARINRMCVSHIYRSICVFFFLLLFLLSTLHIVGDYAICFCNMTEVAIRWSEGKKSAHQFLYEIASDIRVMYTKSHVLYITHVLHIFHIYIAFLYVHIIRITFHCARLLPRRCIFIRLFIRCTYHIYLVLFCFKFSTHSLRSLRSLWVYSILSDYVPRAVHIIWHN